LKDGTSLEELRATLMNFSVKRRFISALMKVSVKQV